MDIPRQIGVGSSVGMIERGVGNNVGKIESVVGKNGMIEMMAKVCRRFGIVVVVDIAFVGMLAFVEDDNLLSRLALGLKLQRAEDSQDTLQRSKKPSGKGLPLTTCRQQNSGVGPVFTGDMFGIDDDRDLAVKNDSRLLLPDKTVVTLRPLHTINHRFSTSPPSLVAPPVHHLPSVAVQLRSSQGFGQIPGSPYLPNLYCEPISSELVLRTNIFRNGLTNPSNI
ncbi:hypothetical protein LXL04_000379 [Taraxacum kok-saghyz]